VKQLDEGLTTQRVIGVYRSALGSARPEAGPIRPRGDALAAGQNWP
jgi:hypothetical protein